MAVLDVWNVLGNTEMLDLSIIEHLVNRIDRTTGHTGCVQLLHPSVGRFPFRKAVDRRIERVAVLRARGRRVVIRIVDELGSADRLGATLPDSSARGGDIDV